MFSFILLIIGSIVSCGLFVAPMPTIIRICKTRTVEENFSAYPFLTTLLNCSLYVLNITHGKRVTLMLVVNGTGIVVECGYIFVAYCFASHRIRVVIVLGVVVETLITFALLTWISIVGPSPHHTSVLGWICVASGILMYASTMISLCDAWKRKTTRDIMWPVIVAGALSTAVWLLYGISDHTQFVLVQNGIGLFVCVVQLLLYGYIRWCRSPGAQQVLELVRQQEQ